MGTAAFIQPSAAVAASVPQAVVPQAAISLPAARTPMIAIQANPSPATASCQTPATKEQLDELRKKLQQLEAVEKDLNNRTSSIPGGKTEPPK
jgi:hypothetical protein